MTKRYDAVCAREYTDARGEVKSSWTRIGVAFEAKQGDGYTLFLDAMPAPTDGQYKIMLRPPRERTPSRPDDDGEIPF